MGYPAADFPLGNVTAGQIERAVRAVCGSAVDVADARQILQALGLSTDRRDA
jgi:hypothetical protein